MKHQRNICLSVLLVVTLLFGIWPYNTIEAETDTTGGIPNR